MRKTTNLDLIGKIFGKLTVLEEMPERVSGHIMWRCLCDCGVETIVRSGSLSSGNTNSCGCLKTKVNKNNKYGNLRALDRTKTEDGWKWRCLCDCGNEVSVLAGNLTSGNTRSCGCLMWTVTSPEMREKMRGSASRHEMGMSYYAWRKAVKERDDYSCIICGRRHTEPGDTDVHHLDGYDWCNEKRHDVANGVTLCAFHHAKYHRIHGMTLAKHEDFLVYYKNETGNDFVQK